MVTANLFNFAQNCERVESLRENAGRHVRLYPALKRGTKLGRPSGAGFRTSPSLDSGRLRLYTINETTGW